MTAVDSVLMPGAGSLDTRSSRVQTRMAEMAARQLYQRMCRRGFVAQVWVTLRKHLTGQALKHRPYQPLLDLREVMAGAKVIDRHAGGVQSVAIEQIRGSEDRLDGLFDREFRPARDYDRTRWIQVATARLQGVCLPAVELIQVGATYFVLDGHHRISVARALGEEFIEANVTVWHVAVERQLQ